MATNLLNKQANNPAIGNLQNYRPWLDGFRAIAILFVLLDHTNYFKPLPFGETGVGLFFALSGYLITGMLLNELRKNSTINLSRFYIRRLARLTPGLVASVLICSAIFFMIGSKRPVLNGLFALTYTTNYAAVFFGHHLSGFGHTWSLAVEEHFYLLWPLFLIFGWRRFGERGLSYAAIMIAISVLIWRAFLYHFDAPEILLYVGTIERLDALMYGCFFAMIVSLGWQPKKYHIVFGILVILLSIEMKGAEKSIIGSAMLGLAGALTVASIDKQTIPAISNILSAHILVNIGLISYSLYLWHLPVYQITEILFGQGLLVKLLAILISLAAATLSYHFLEMPIRNWVRAKTT